VVAVSTRGFFARQPTHVVSCFRALSHTLHYSRDGDTIELSRGFTVPFTLRPPVAVKIVGCKSGDNPPPTLRATGCFALIRTTQPIVVEGVHFEGKRHQWSSDTAYAVDAIGALKVGGPCLMVHCTVSNYCAGLLLCDAHCEDVSPAVQASREYIPPMYHVLMHDNVFNNNARAVINFDTHGLLRKCIRTDNAFEKTGSLNEDLMQLWLRLVTSRCIPSFD
jgi:hypothetical protein